MAPTHIINPVISLTRTIQVRFSITPKEIITTQVTPPAQTIRITKVHSKIKEVWDLLPSNLLTVQEATTTAVALAMEPLSSIHKVQEGKRRLLITTIQADLPETMVELIQVKASTAAAAAREEETATLITGVQSRVDFTMAAAAQDNSKIIIKISHNLNTITISEKE